MHEHKSTTMDLDKTRLSQFITILSDEELATILKNLKSEIETIISRTE